MKEFNERTSPVPTRPPAKGETVFSPHKDLRALDRYAQLMDRARNSVFMTAAFGVSDELRKVFEADKPYLRYLLLERRDSKITTISRDPENQVAAGAFIGTGGWRQWQAEKLSRLGLNEHVRFIHTKIMLVDPLTDDPSVISGSANFSKASTTSNDENMLVIRGDSRVADIYLTEFMRTFTAFHFRGKVGATGSAAAPAPGERTPRAPRHVHLAESDEWARPFFQRGESKDKERRLFR